MTDLLLCAFLLATPLVCLLVMHWIERALWVRKTDRMWRCGLRYGVGHGMIKRDDTN